MWNAYKDGKLIRECVTYKGALNAIKPLKEFDKKAKFEVKFEEKSK